MNKTVLLIWNCEDSGALFSALTVIAGGITANIHAQYICMHLLSMHFLITFTYHNSSPFCFYRSNYYGMPLLTSQWLSDKSRGDPHCYWIPCAIQSWVSFYRHTKASAVMHKSGMLLMLFILFSSQSDPNWLNLQKIPRVTSQVDDFPSAPFYLFLLFC